jgi:hypothetical protein
LYVGSSVYFTAEYASSTKRNKTHWVACPMDTSLTLQRRSNPIIHWENVGFVMSTTTTSWRSTRNFLPPPKEIYDNPISTEKVEACGIAGLTVLTKEYAIGDENDTPLKPKYERTVCMLGMSILVRRKELRESAHN